MQTSYLVTKGSEILAVIAKAEDGSHWSEIKSLVAAHPGSEVQAVVTVENACPRHPAFEADYCPRCAEEA